MQWFKEETIQTDILHIFFWSRMDELELPVYGKNSEKGWIPLRNITPRLKDIFRMVKTDDIESYINKKAYKFLNHPFIESRHKKHKKGALMFLDKENKGQPKKRKMSAYRLKRNLDTWKKLYIYCYERGMMEEFLPSDYALDMRRLTNKLYLKFFEELSKESRFISKIDKDSPWLDMRTELQRLFYLFLKNKKAFKESINMTETVFLRYSPLLLQKIGINKLEKDLFSEAFLTFLNAAELQNQFIESLFKHYTKPYVPKRKKRSEKFKEELARRRVGVEPNEYGAPSGN